MYIEETNISVQVGEPVGKERMFYCVNLSDYKFCQASSLGTAY